MFSESPVKRKDRIATEAKRDQTRGRRKPKAKNKIPELQIYEPKEIFEEKDGSARRLRKPTNYLKLNEGILCRSQRGEPVTE